MKTARKASPAEKIHLLYRILEKNPPDREMWEENLRFCRDALYQEMLSEADRGTIGDLDSFLEKVLQLDDPSGFCESMPDGGKELREKLLNDLKLAAGAAEYSRLEYGMMIWRELEFEENDTIREFQSRLNGIKKEGETRAKIRDLTVEILRMIAGNKDYRAVENYYKLILMNDLKINGEMTDKITDYISSGKRIERRRNIRRMVLVVAGAICFCAAAGFWLKDYSSSQLSKSRSEVLKELYNRQMFRQMTDLMSVFRQNQPESMEREPLLSTMTLLGEKEREILAGDALFEALLRKAEKFPSDGILSELEKLQAQRKQEALFRYQWLKRKQEQEKHQKILAERAGIQNLSVRCNELAGMLKQGVDIRQEELAELERQIRAFPENDGLKRQFLQLQERWKYNCKKEEYRKTLEKPGSAEEWLNMWEDLAFLFPELAKPYEKILPHLPLWRELCHFPGWQREQLNDPEQLYALAEGCRSAPRTPAEADLFLLVNPRSAELIREMLKLLADGFPEKGLSEVVFRDKAGEKRIFYVTGIEQEKTYFNERIKTLILYVPGTVYYFRNRGEFYIRTDQPGEPLILETALSRNGDAPEAVHWSFFKRMREELLHTPGHQLPEALRNCFYQLCALKNVLPEWKKSTLEVMLRYRAELSPAVKQLMLELKPPYDDSAVIGAEKELRKKLKERLCRRLVPAAYWNGKERLLFGEPSGLLHIRYGEDGTFTIEPPAAGDPPGTLYFSYRPY